MSTYARLTQLYSNEWTRKCGDYVPFEQVSKLIFEDFALAAFVIDFINQTLQCDAKSMAILDIGCGSKPTAKKMKNENAKSPILRLTSIFQTVFLSIYFV